MLAESLIYENCFRQIFENVNQQKLCGSNIWPYSLPAEWNGFPSERYLQNGMGFHLLPAEWNGFPSERGMGFRLNVAIFQSNCTEVLHLP